MANSEDLLKKLMVTFREEAGEHLDQLSFLLISLEREDGKEERQRLIETLYRRMHTLKGSAQAVNLFEAVEICQSLETLFASLKRGEISPGSELLNRLHAGVDTIAGIIFPMGERGGAVEQAGRTASTGGAGGKELTTGNGTDEATSAAEPPTERPRSEETVRVSARLLDDLLLQTEELISAKLSAAELVNELSAMSRELSDLKGGKNTDAIAGRMEKRLGVVVNAAEKNLRLLGGKVDSLLNDMKKVHLFPFSAFMEPFPKIVRDIARDLGKEVELIRSTGEMAIDRRILAGLKEPIIHMVRNVIDHGMESVPERLSAGKPRAGRIEVSISQRDGNSAELVLTDDGRGIDLEQVKAAAVRHGIILPQQAESLSDPDALRLVFHSGVSTAPIITSLSGRGLGLAIVREAVEGLGGEVNVTSRPGMGTEFRIVFPLSFSTIRCLLVEAHGRKCLIPTANVELAARIPCGGIKTMENRETISIGQTALSLVRLGDLLGVPPLAGEAVPEQIPVVVLSSADKRIAFAVDQLLDVDEVLVKALGPQLSRVKNVAGATVLGNGEAVPVLNVGDILKSAADIPSSIFSGSASDRKEAKGARVLVAEDSITSRTLLKNLLESSGFRVRTAIDGAEAMVLLKSEEFDIVVSDVEMPRMDGFELTAGIRGDTNLSSLPVVLVTGLESREDREKGIEVGASAYIVKSSFDQSGLIEVIRKLT